MNWDKKIDLINVLVVAFMVLAAGVFMFYYNQQIVNECTSNPLVFGARQLEDRTGFAFYGTGYFKAEEVYPGVRGMILFNSTGSVLQK